MTENNILKKHNFQFQKKFGQNFLTDFKIPAKIAENCTNFKYNGEDKGKSLILEIGPGAGILTKELAKRFLKVVAVEIDSELIPILDESLASFSNIEVINDDIMKTDLEKLISSRRIYENEVLPVSVCANLPYYITTPVIMKLLEEYHDFSFITVMVQKEVARRLCSKPGSTDYGAITAVINLYGKMEKLFDVPAGCFNPRPKVDSSVVRFKRNEIQKYTETEIKDAKKVIKAAFSMRRKTLINTLVAIGDIKCGKEELANIIEELFGKPSIRGEELSTEDFVKIARRIF